jgi:hypothetical protein
MVFGSCPPLALLFLLPTQNRPRPKEFIKHYKTVQFTTYNILVLETGDNTESVRQVNEIENGNLMARKILTRLS